MKNLFLGCGFLLAIAILLAAFEALIASLLWNWIAPIFWSSAPVLNMWQAFGVLILLNICFSAFRKK